MSAISGQIAEPAGNLSRYGVENASVLTRHAAATVKYTRSGTVYTDTIAANSAATLWASSPASSVVDLTKAPLVTFVLPSNGGTDTLYCCTETIWYSTVIAQRDAIPLDFVTFERIQRYQVVPISAAAIGVTGGAAEGGGTYGAFDTHSSQGGGSVTGIPTRFDSQSSSGTNGEIVGLFVKVSALPASDMTLIDIDGGATAYLRLKLASTGHIWAESSMASGHARTLDISNAAIATATWYWASACTVSRQGNYEILGQVWKVDGTTQGQQSSGFQSDANFNATSTPTATLGVGVHHSASYLDFPNTAGNEWSKVQVQHATSTSAPFSPPSSDVAAGSNDALYLCRDTTGPQTTLLDSTNNHYDLSGTMTVVSDGPYA